MFNVGAAMPHLLTSLVVVSPDLQYLRNEKTPCLYHFVNAKDVKSYFMRYRKRKTTKNTKRKRSESRDANGIHPFGGKVVCHFSFNPHSHGNISGCLAPSLPITVE
jgi:hypothetical protein